MTRRNYPARFVRPGAAHEVALAVAGEMGEFRLPEPNRGPLTDVLAEALYHLLPLASAGGDAPLASDRAAYLRLAGDSQVAIRRAAAEFQAFVHEVVRAGVTVRTPESDTDRVRTVAEVMHDLKPYLPRVLFQPLQAMPVEQLVAADLGTVRRHYVGFAWEACRATAAAMVETIESLFRLMAAGLIEFFDGGAARVIYCRGPVPRVNGTRTARAYPQSLASHPFFEHPQWVAGRVFELLDVRPAADRTVRGQVPTRAAAMKAAVPGWLRPQVKEVCGQKVRAAAGFVDPADGSQHAEDRATYVGCSCVVLADQFVLATWEENECPSLLRQLFGIAR